jgi:hypothetical protein
VVSELTLVSGGWFTTGPAGSRRDYPHSSDYQQNEAGHVSRPVFFGESWHVTRFASDRFRPTLRGDANDAC